MLDLFKLDTSKELIVTSKDIEGFTYHALDEEYFGYIEQKYDDGDNYSSTFIRLFLRWKSEDDEVGHTWEALCTVQGIDEVLEECRHTYFFNNGYVFYLNSKHMRLMLDFLETKYDMD